MKILILGGTGFTGPHIARALGAAGHDVRVYHRGRHMLDPLPENVKKINAELSSLRVYRAALRQLQFDVVLHMLAMNRYDAQQAIDTFGGHAGRIVVASSQDVYAPFGALHGKETSEVPPQAHPMTEDAPLRTSRKIMGGEYEKIYMEQGFLERQARLPVTILRMPATYGPGDPRHRFAEWIRRFDTGRPAILLEPGMANFRWTHAYVENVARAFVLAVTTPHPEGVTSRIYNVSESVAAHTGVTSGAPTKGERLHALARAAGYRGRIVVVPRDRCPPHLIKPLDFRHDIVTSDARLRAELGFSEVVDAEEGLRRTVAWQRGNMPTEWEPGTFDDAAEDAVMKELGVVNDE